MANSIQVLKQTELCGHQFTVYGTVEEPLFRAKDVAEVINHNNISHMLSLVDDDEKGVTQFVTPGGNQQVWMLTEGGLYEVLMQSRKPIAKQFKKGVKQILHEVRTTGGYISTTHDDTPEEIMARAITIAQATLAKREERLKELEYKNAQLEQEHHENQPKVEFANSVMQSTDCIGIGEMAQILKQNKLSRMGQNRFYEWLRYNGFLLQRGSRRNLPAQKSINLGIMKIAESVCDSRMGVIINRKAVITPQGQAYFVDYFRKLSNNGYKLFL